MAGGDQDVGTSSHHNNDKVEPAPSVVKIRVEPECQPFDQHFQKEDHGEDPVHVVQDVLQQRSFCQVHVFQRLDIISRVLHENEIKVGRKNGAKKLRKG
jgi:hypothetical protein